MREFEIAKKVLVAFRNKCPDKFLLELGSPYCVFENNKFDFSSYANETRGNLKKKFFSAVKKVFADQSIDEIDPSILCDFISLSSTFLNGLEAIIGAESIYKALSKIKNFSTLGYFLGKKEEALPTMPIRIIALLLNRLP